MTIARLVAAANELLEVCEAEMWSPMECVYLRNAIASLPADMGEQEYVVVKRDVLDNAALDLDTMSIAFDQCGMKQCRNVAFNLAYKLRACLDQQKGGG